MIGVLLLALLPALGELPAQTLGPDQCAMALWDRGSRQRIAFWRAAGPLLLATTPEPTSLAPVPGSGSGAPVLGLLPQAGFAGGGLTATLAVTIVASVDGRSATISAGTLSLTAADGETRIMAVAGVVGCG